MKTVTVYGCNMGPRCGNATAILLEPWPKPQTMSINGGPTFECDTDLKWHVRVPDDSKILANSSGLQQVLRVGMHTHTPNQVLAMADLGINGFAFAAEATNGK